MIKTRLDYFFIYILAFIVALVLVAVIIPSNKTEYHELTILPFDNYDKYPIEKFSYSIENSDEVILSGSATYNSTLKIPVSKEGINIIYLWSDKYYTSKIITLKINSDNTTKSNFYPQLYRMGIITFNQTGKLLDGYVNLTLSSDALVNDPLFCYSGYKANISISEAVYSTRVPEEFKSLEPRCFIFYNKLENNSITLKITAFSENKIIFTVHDVDSFKFNNTWNRDMEDSNGKNIGGETFFHLIE